MARSNPWPTTDFKLGQPACDLQVWDQWSPPFDLWGCSKIIASLYAAACAMCHVPPIDSWQAPSSFRRFGASNGATPGPIGPAVRALFPKTLGHTYWLTDWLTDWPTNTSGQLFFTDPPVEIFVHRTFNAKAFERSFTTILEKNSRLRIFFLSQTTNGGFRKVTLSFVNTRRKKVADRKKYLTDEFTVG